MLYACHNDLYRHTAYIIRVICEPKYMAIYGLYNYEWAKVLNIFFNKGAGSCCGEFRLTSTSLPDITTESHCVIGTAGRDHCRNPQHNSSSSQLVSSMQELILIIQSLNFLDNSSEIWWHRSYASFETSVSVLDALKLRHRYGHILTLLASKKVQLIRPRYNALDVVRVQPILLGKQILHRPQLKRHKRLHLLLRASKVFFGDVKTRFYAFFEICSFFGKFGMQAIVSIFQNWLSFWDRERLMGS